MPRTKEPRNVEFEQALPSGLTTQFWGPLHGEKIMLKESEAKMIEAFGVIENFNNHCRNEGANILTKLRERQIGDKDDSDVNRALGYYWEYLAGFAVNILRALRENDTGRHIKAVVQLQNEGTLEMDEEQYKHLEMCGFFTDIIKSAKSHKEFQALMDSGLTRAEAFEKKHGPFPKKPE